MSAFPGAPGGVVEGAERLDDRRVLNGIVGKFRTGTSWGDVPDRYGPWATPHTCFRRWAADGMFDRMLRAAQAKADAAGDVEWLVSVDSTVVRAHQHVAGAGKEGSVARGGTTSKNHRVLRGRRHPRVTPDAGGTFDDRT
ncbi:transposase [Streptomyces sp. NPDC059247]|uniref:transposase n=1 Tax=Streptomyces sp. NPDC059247 TaxID=3346790 RepID=UPI00369A6B61